VLRALCGETFVSLEMNMKNRLIRTGLILALAACALAVSADAVTVPKVAFTDTRLKNGLRVIMSEDHAAPVVSLSIVYDVGSRNERKGRTGFAHLFEHMMFKGSENVGDGELASLIENYGGDHNGSTDKEHTIYFERVPSNQLDMILFLEADRMRSLDKTITKEKLDNQRAAVQEERRFRMDNQPYGKVGEVFDELAFENFAYEHSVIGSMDDLSAATVEDVAAFFRTYYAPNNAVLALVGDFDAKVALEKVRKYFESVPPGPVPPAVDATEPPQKEERRRTIEDPLARLSLIVAGYHTPAGLTPDVDALTALGSILGSGRSGRLYESLVRQQQIAVQVYAIGLASRGPGMFELQAVVAPGQPVDKVAAAMYAEVEKIKTGKIEEWEMEKARNGALRRLVDSLRSSLQRTQLLSRYAVFYNDPGLINTRYERIAAVRAEDVQRVARQYLTPTNRTVLTTLPAKNAGAAQ